LLLERVVGIFNHMVKYKEGKLEQELDFVFISLADPIRRRILRRITQRSLTVSEIGKPYDVSLPAISKHLRILERAGLITRVKQGRERIVRLNPAAFKRADQYVTYYKQFWDKKLDTLQSYLEGGDK